MNAPASLLPLVRRLLRGVAIVPDLPTALRLKKENPVLQFATMAGEFISTAGVVFGGSAQSQTESLLGRKLLIGETAAELSRLENEAAALHAKSRANARPASPPRWMRWKSSRRRHQAAHVSQSGSAAQIVLLDHELRAAEEKLRQLQSERTTLEQQTTFADERVAQLEQEFAALTSNVNEEQARQVRRGRRERAGAPARSGNVGVAPIVAPRGRDRAATPRKSAQPTPADGRTRGRIGRNDRRAPRRHRQLRAPSRIADDRNRRKRKPRSKRKARS